MKNQILVTITACTLLLACAARAVEGGSGHYTPGTYLDFSAMTPTQPGLYVVNYFLDYANASAAASKELPRGGIFAAGLTANVQAEAPGVIYAYPFSFDNITFSSGIYPSWVWADAKVTATFNRDGTPRTGAIEQSVNGFGDLQLTPI